MHMSLRVTMAMFILGQIKQQAEALRLKAQSEELVDSEALWLKAWSYLSWDTQSKQNVRNEEATPVDHGTMLLQLNRLLTLIPQDNVLHRFHSLRPLTELSDAPVIAFIMDIGLRMEAAQEAYTILRSFSQLSVTQTVSMNMRPDKLQRSTLANHIQLQIAKLSAR